MAEDPEPEGAEHVAKKNLPSYHRARAPLKHTDLGTQLIRRIKYSDQKELASMLVPLILRSGAGAVGIVTLARVVMPETLAV